MVVSWIYSRFIALNFFDIADSPHDFPNIDIWGAYLPHFLNEYGDNQTQHLRYFHKCIMNMGDGFYLYKHRCWCKGTTSHFFAVT